MNIVHLVIDDKFIDMAIREFETVAPGANEFLILDANPPYRYLKDQRVRRVDLQGFAMAVARADVGGVIFHTLQPNHLPALQRVPAGRKVVWIGWGYDYYGLLNDAFPDGLLLPSTTSLVAAQAARRQHEFVPAQLSFARPYPKPSGAAIAVLRRVDIFCPVVSTEHRLMQRYNSWFRARYLRWNYGSVEDDLSLDAGHSEELGENLLIGNSATATNNHLELFDLIRRRGDIDGRQLIVPLSYGDPHYRQHILHVGKQQFGSAFVPLIDFLPKERYIELLGSCGIVLMNHIRQQALGNIYISALLGAHIYLNRRNPLFDWLGSEGLYIGDVEQPDLQPLSPAQREQQIDTVRARMGREAQRERTRRLVQAVLESTV